jgi:choline dehydrogenase-like flavoprotein
MDFDVIVIGSGFGRAITSCRLAQQGKKVLVLERGHKWDRTTYPRNPEDEWSHAYPERYHGWADLRRFKGMAVIAGVGVGGGSLIYANVSAVPPVTVFNSGWPPEITFAGLQPYYASVASVLDIREVPKNQWIPRVQLMRDAATQLGRRSAFVRPTSPSHMTKTLSTTSVSNLTSRTESDLSTSMASNRAPARIRANAISVAVPMPRTRWIRTICAWPNKTAP